jgi:hypothetical protein
MTPEFILNFIHPRLNEPCTAIGGSYCLTREELLLFRGEKVLYLVGWAAVDTSCCGPGGCGYSLVPGMVRSWKTALSEEGLPISRIIPISSQGDRAAVRRLIEQAEGPVQVRFFAG